LSHCLAVEELDPATVVRDHNGQQLAYVYFEDEPGRRSAAKLLIKDEARKHCGQYRQAVTIVSAAFLLYSRPAALFCEE
jgi:hypothetical protein